MSRAQVKGGSHDFIPWGGAGVEDRKGIKHRSGADRVAPRLARQTARMPPLAYGLEKHPGHGPVEPPSPATKTKGDLELEALGPDLKVVSPAKRRPDTYERHPTTAEGFPPLSGTPHRRWGTRKDDVSLIHLPNPGTRHGTPHHTLQI